MHDEHFKQNCLLAAQRHYILVEKVGAGLDGEVYLAIPRRDLREGLRDPTSIRQVTQVVKIPSDPSAVRSLRQEGRFLRTLEGSRYMPWATKSVDDRQPYAYLGMDWIRGPTLDDFMRANNDIAAAFVFSILADLLEAYLDMQNRGVDHGDLHINNILLDFGHCSREGIPRAKIIDFSRASSVPARGSRLSTTDLPMIGSAVYCMMEYCNDAGRLGNNAKERHRPPHQYSQTRHGAGALYDLEFRASTETLPELKVAT